MRICENMPSKIDVLIDCRPVRTPITGVARYCIGLSNALNRVAGNNAIDATALVGGRGKNDHIGLIESGNYSRIGDRIVPQVLLNAVNEYLPTVNKLVNSRNFDIAHETYFANIAIRSKFKIATIHDTFPLDFPEGYSTRNIKYSQRNLFRQVSESDLIISVSEYTKKRIVDITGCSSEKIRVIGLGVDLPSRAESKQVAPVESPFYLVIGNIEPRKNLERLIDAWISSNVWQTGAKLLIAGRLLYKSDTFSKKVQAARGYSVVYLGEVDEQEKDVLFRNMRALIFPSLLEGFGIPAIEAYRYGRPALLANSSALAELVVRPEWSFDPLNVESMASAISTFHNRPDDILVDDLMTVGKSFSWTAVAEKTIELYRVLGKK